MNGTIGIIVPIYNVEKYIHRCIDSILAQTYTNYILFLIDDCSTDESASICDDYSKMDTRIEVIHLNKNSGIANACNIGLDEIDKTSIEYVTFIDSDDWVDNTHLENMMKAVRDTGCQIVWSGNKWVNEERREIFEFTLEDKLIEAKELLLNEKVRVWYSFRWGKLYKRELFQGIRYNTEHRYYEDGATTFKLLYYAGEIALCSSKTYMYYCSNASLTRSKWTEEKGDCGIFSSTEKIRFYEECKEEELVKAAYIAYINDIILNMRACLNEKDHKPYYKKMRKLYCQVYLYVKKNIYAPDASKIKYRLIRWVPGFLNIYEIYLSAKKKIK